MLGGLVVAYALYGAAAGNVLAKDRISMSRVYREDKPITFWVIIACYVLVGGMIVAIPNARIG